MVFVSITRLRLRSAFYLLPFFWHTYRSGKQLQTESNFIKGKTLMDKKLTFWTMTLWNNEVDMRTYRNSNAHKKAMPKLQHWCNEASVVHWQQEENKFPGWLEAHRRMQTDGRASKVRNPSADHLAFSFPSPRWPSKTEQTLLPKRRQ
jgi:hypothetical protein